MTKLKHVKLYENFDQMGNEAPKFIWMGFSQSKNGYCAGIVSSEEAELLKSTVPGDIVPLADNIYVYVELDQTEMRAENEEFNIDDASFVAADGDDNYWDEPDYDKLVIELPSEGIMTTEPDQNGLNGKVMSVEEFINMEK